MDLTKDQILDRITEEINSQTLFQLLSRYEQLLGVIIIYKEKLRVLKDKKTEEESRIWVEISNDSSIKTVVKKAVFELAKNNDSKYNDLNTDYHDLKRLIDRIEDLIKIIDRKYKLVEAAFNASGFLTYNEVERNYNR